ncbi:HEPN domain-containing protein [Priestia megaterium]|uniref:HEPN domain-containing protein n=1 Tax=Priestia megaterium TaxID=1404 RepID=UPI0011B4C7C5|nr:HEPN domain-containing protein [Priestia megaterium]QDZ88055.1 hypothetical protein D0441_27560 [Priestia megaterium]
MNYTKALSITRDLLKRVKGGQIQYIAYRSNFEQKWERYSLIMEDIGLLFHGEEDVRAFSETVYILWKENKELYEEYTEMTFKKELIEFLNNFEQVEEFSLEHLKRFLRKLILGKKPLEFEVLYPLYGAEYKKSHLLKIGPYTIYNSDIHRQQLLEKYPYTSERIISELNEFTGTSNLVISVNVKARHSDKANERAIVKLQHFENTIRFIIADQARYTKERNNYDIGIFNFNETKRTRGLLFSEQLSVSTISLTGAFENIDLHDFPIQDPDYAYDEIWVILEKEKPTELEKRIMSAITWVGKGLRDEESTRALVQYVFALESLLQFQQKNTLVSPSITYKMAELAAFIIGEEYEDRSKIEDLVKRIYSKRSAIAHGGSHEVDESILDNALWLIQNLIMRLIVDEELKKSISIQEVDAWVKIQKYS